MWDLEGTCPLYKVYDKLTLPPKKVIRVSEMKYPKSKHPKPVYFLLLKLYNMSDYGIISRNFYWLHLSGGDYKLLEPYRKKNVPLKITSQTFIKGSSYEIEMHVQNKSQKPDVNAPVCTNDFVTWPAMGDFDANSVEEKHSCSKESSGSSLFRRICQRFLRGEDGLMVSEVNGSDNGVAFFLHFSVHASKTDHKEGKDTRILPVYYSDNYFSLVPGESMSVKMSFNVPSGVSPRVTLQGWNHHGSHNVL